jgi:hypothetical protein
MNTRKEFSTQIRHRYTQIKCRLIKYYLQKSVKSASSMCLQINKLSKTKISKKTRDEKIKYFISNRNYFHLDV